MGLFSRGSKGDDVSRKSKRSGEDETSVNSGVDHAPAEGESETDNELEQTAQPLDDRSGEDETSINSGVRHAPEDVAHRAAVPQDSDETDEDYQDRLARLAGTGAPPSEITPPVPPPRNALTAADEMREDTRRSRIRQYVLEQGLVSPGAIGDMSDEELDAVYERAIGRSGRDQTTPTPELSFSPAQHAQQVLLSTSREDKLALVGERSNLTYAQAAQLTPEDLDAQVRTVVLNELQLEETKKAQEAAKLRPLDEQPYGGDPPHYYAVLKGVRYQGDGGVVAINPGEVINDRSHNIADLKGKGVELIEVVAPPLANLG
jgi:hypothetical protein